MYQVEQERSVRLPTYAQNRLAPAAPKCVLCMCSRKNIGENLCGHGKGHGSITPKKSQELIYTHCCSVDKGTQRSGRELFVLWD
jgi:hypothetical protein